MNNINSILDFVNEHQSPTYNGYSDFDECKYCPDRCTTKCYPTCNTYRVKRAIMQLNENIVTRQYKSQLYLFNKKFEAQINKYSYIELLPRDAITWTNVLADDMVCCVVNKGEWFRWTLMH